MTADYDAIVVGAGIIGACVGFELAKAGLRVLNIDMLPAAGYGSTGNSCAIIRTHYSTLDGAALAYEGYRYWTNWQDYLGAVDERGPAAYVPVGCLFTQTEANGYGANLIRISAELGIPFEEMDPEALRRRVPIIDPGSFHPVRRPEDPDFAKSAGPLRGVVYFPLAGYISDPQLATHNVQRAAEARGARYRFNARVGEIRRTDGRVAGVTLTDGDEIDAPIVVNAAGPHSYLLNRLAGVEEGMNIKTRALRVEVAHVPAPEGFDFERDGIIGSDNDIGGYYRPEVGNHILVGSEEPACDPLDWVDPDDYDRNMSEQGRVQVLRAAQRFPTMPIPDTLKGIVDLYDTADDWIPIYDGSDLPGYYMAIGTSGNQFKNGPVVGKLMSALILACEKGRDHDRDPVAFRLEQLDRDLDLGFFSRRRAINRDSSFSVVG